MIDYLSAILGGAIGIGSALILDVYRRYMASRGKFIFELLNKQFLHHKGRDELGNVPYHMGIPDSEAMGYVFTISVRVANHSDTPRSLSIKDIHFCTEYPKIIGNERHIPSTLIVEDYKLLDWQGKDLGNKVGVGAKDFQLFKITGNAELSGHRNQIADDFRLKCLRDWRVISIAFTKSPDEVLYFNLDVLPDDPDRPN